MNLNTEVKKFKQKCDNIILQNNSFAKQSHIIHNTKIDVYSYYLTDFEAFKELDAYELRGVAVTDDRIWYTIPKFFNLNQTNDTLYQNIRHKQIKKVYEKVDGYLIQFLKLNNKIIIKSKTSFKSEFKFKALDLYNKNIIIKKFIKKYIDKYNLIFELIDTKNQIVVEYDIDDLKLIMIRDLNGNILTYDEFEALESEIPNSLKVQEYNLTLDEICKIAEHSEENREGFVIYFTDNTLIKVKTEHYLKLHRIRTETTPKDIIQMVLDEKIDDYLGMFTGTKLEQIKDIINKTNNKYYEYKSLLQNIDFNINKKDFAIKHKNNKDFSLLIEYYKSKNYTEIKKYMLRNIKKLAQEFTF